MHRSCADILFFRGTPSPPSSVQDKHFKRLHSNTEIIRHDELQKRKIPSPHTVMLGQDQTTNPAVPPGLTLSRPPHPYHHTVALFTECRSVAHRAGTPPSDCPPKSIHTIQSVPRSQHRAALCDILKTGYLLFINGFNSLMKLFWILLLHCDKVKRDFYEPAANKEESPGKTGALW